jgi:hypothetical protein
VGSRNRGAGSDQSWSRCGTLVPEPHDPERGNPSAVGVGGRDNRTGPDRDVPADLITISRRQPSVAPSRANTGDSSGLGRAITGDGRAILSSEADNHLR